MSQVAAENSKLGRIWEESKQAQLAEKLNHSLYIRQLILGKTQPGKILVSK